MSAPHDAIIIVFDIGRSVSKQNFTEEKTFFEQSKSCISWIIQRKLISQSKDVLSLLLIGSEKTKTTLTISGYKNIYCVFDFQLASWDMLTFIENEVKPTNYKSDWIGGLIISMEMLKNYEFGYIENRKIVFFSDFSASISDDLDVVSKSLKSSNIELTIIGPDCITSFAGNDEFEQPPLKKRRSGSQEENVENLIYNLWRKAPEHVTICSFKSALKQLCSYVRKSCRATPWNCILDIGDVKINISMFKKTDPKVSMKMTTNTLRPKENDPDSGIGSETSSRSEIASTIRDKVMVYKHEKEGEIEDIEVKEEDTIEGFHFGTTIIPFSEEDKAVMEYKSGPKCFSVIGFTNISLVPYYLLSGECSYIVVPRDKDQNAEVAFSAITQAMKKLECLAVVRRVYSEDRGLCLGILSPVIEEIDCDETDDEIIFKEYLLFTELAFDGEIKSINFPSLGHLMKKISQSQLDAIDNLIDGMDLMKADRESQGEFSEALDTNKLHDFKEQFFQYCVIQRGLYPEKPLPTSLPTYIEEFIKMPKSLQEKCKLLTEELKQNFKIEYKKGSPIPEKTKSKTKSKVDDTQASSSSTHVENKKEEMEHFSESSLKEEKDQIKLKLMKLFRKKLPTNLEIDECLEDLLEDCSKKPEIIRCFKEVVGHVRQKYFNVNPDNFNNWINKFKAYAHESGEIELEIWNEIASEKLGLISEKDNKMSLISEKEAETFESEKISKRLLADSSTNKQNIEDIDSDSLKELKAETLVQQNDMTSNGTDLTMAASSSPATSEPVNVSASSQTVVVRGCRYRQRQLGPAPFASFEDLSDELDSPPETARTPLPGIKEDPSSQLQSPNATSPQVANVSLTEKEEQGLRDALTSSLYTPQPPRIDISRASSSSQHEDSITSSPERENGAQNLGYKEDGTVDLRSSTEELDYVKESGTVEESEEKRKRERMLRKQQQVRDFCDTQSQHELVERKDSSCSVMSDTGLLCISGRTSRLSSISSAASGGSAASGTSHLSVGSHMSGRSTRSPSPHKMLLETSFCGAKPLNSQNLEPEIPSGLVNAIEKSASRPPSRLRSRSPSPHKMLLETSFCGTKQIPAAEIETKSKVPVVKTVEKPKSKLSPVVADSEIISQKLEEQSTTQLLKKAPDSKKISEKVSKIEISTVQKVQQIKPLEATPQSKSPASIPKKAAVKPASRPKKIISIRDIPGDEIFIPLKGPEIDFEEIIRKASPMVKKKSEKPEKTRKQESADEIFIPLHSPPKTNKENIQDKNFSDFKQNFDDGIYIPLHSPPKGSVESSTKLNLPKKPKTPSGEKHRKEIHIPKKREYEVCEDGSIFIPLHSPEEERAARNFEDEIKRVDQELQKAREAAEKKSREEEKQSKPATLDLSDSGSQKSRLSQTFPTGKSEVPSGGSRTPSPGSSLSRKSSFASLFRKSDFSGSPDSQGGSVIRKKSGTFSNILKEAGDGFRERSRSRSKSRERQPQPSITRSPSVKKNVFSSIFSKKKLETKGGSGKDNSEISPRLDLQFTFNSETENKKTYDEGDYIIIPLRDPSDPPVDLDYFENEADGSGEKEPDRSPSPFVIVERTESPTIRRNRQTENKSSDKAEVSFRTKLESEVNVESEINEENVKCIKTPLEVKTPENIFSKTSLEDLVVKQTVNQLTLDNSKEFVKTQFLDSENKTGASKSQEKNLSSKLLETESTLEKTSDSAVEIKDSVCSDKRLEERNKKSDGTLQHDSSIDFEDKEPREEIVAVSDGGVRKLKLPPVPGDLEDDHERKGLVYQESFEDELPYVPTTLPLERSLGVQIVPVKHRVAEIKTCPIERPRSTTPINPTSLEDFVTSKEAVLVSQEEKMKISLPRDDSITYKSKSPRRYSAKGKTWVEFAEAGLQSPRDYRKSSLRTTPSPPPLPPRSSPPSVLSTSAPPTTTSWINFEELPEKRKLPKKITTIPTLRSSVDGGGISDKSSASVSGGVVYSYVSPEDCQCECHEHNSSHTKETDSKRGTNGKS